MSTLRAGFAPARQVRLPMLYPRFSKPFSMPISSLLPSRSCKSSPLRLRYPAISQIRWASTAPNSAPTPAPHPHRHPKPLVRFFYRFFFYAGFFILTSGGLVLAFFIYDASTYKGGPAVADVPVSLAALDPRRGGPKNLPIVDTFIDDDESQEQIACKDKPRLVVLGSGWAGTSLLKNIQDQAYHVTVISDVNYFLFTPLLPSATVGTLELRSLVEPVRRIVHRVSGHFLKASAVDVDFSERLVEVSQTDAQGVQQNFYVPYDKLVIGVGATSNTHGVKGLEHCHYLKTINDARQIRNKILSNLEQACLPTTSDAERRRLLSFVVCGGGPTGVETASEIYEMLNEDLLKSYPKLLRNEVSVSIIQSRGHILNTYDEALSVYAEDKLAHEDIQILTNARVKEVQSDKIIFTQKSDDGKLIERELPNGFCLWSTGIAQTQLGESLAKKLANQTNKHALETDSHLRLLGTPLGTVYAIGDCSTVNNNVADHIVHFLRSIAAEKGQDPSTVRLTFGDFRSVSAKIKKRFPQATDHLKRLDKLFSQYDEDQDGTLSFSELHNLLKQISDRLTSHPATAQVASQKGQYLARKLNRLAQTSEGFLANDVLDGDVDEAVYKAFDFHSRGTTASISGGAIFDFNGLSFGGGLLAMYLWRGVYFAQSVAWRTRIVLAMDWTKRALFGRDLVDY